MNTLPALLQRDEVLVVPGAYDAFTAKLTQISGFSAVYLSGAGVSYSTLGYPDIGLITQSEMTNRLAQVKQAVSIPVIADCDTGYGNAINLIRTVRLFEAAGASAIQIEDQQFPKKCGHLSGKELIPRGEMVQKIQAALEARESEGFLIIARTDARTVLGMEEAIARGQAYAEAGADLIFVESPQSLEELEIIGRALAGHHLVANMVEGGATPLISAATLQDFGFSVVIYPNSLTRRFALAGLNLLADLRSNGDTRSNLNQMMSFIELNELLGLEEFRDLEQRFLPRPEK